MTMKKQNKKASKAKSSKGSRKKKAVTLDNLMVPKGKDDWTPSDEDVAEALTRYGQLDEIDRAIIRAKVQHPSMTIKEMAAMNGLTYMACFKRWHSPKVQKAYDDMTMEVSKLWAATVRDTIQRMRGIIMGRDDALAIKAANLILQRYVTHVGFFNQGGGQAADENGQGGTMYVYQSTVTSNGSLSGALKEIRESEAHTFDTTFNEAPNPKTPDPVTDEDQE